VVLAIELDPVLARSLLRIDRPNVYVHRGVALDVVPPPGPYRVVGNAPFGIGTGLLRRFLSDPLVTRLDLILQREAARKRARGRGNALAVVWAVSWAIEVAREIPRHAFHPAPGVDAAWLRARRRPEPLLPPERLPPFERFVRATFARGSFERLGIPPSALAAIDVDARTRPAELDVERWVALHRRIAPSPADRRAPSVGG
jgi:23S rRNA (adenine-N6)-dimethyltransferase